MVRSVLVTLFSFYALCGLAQEQTKVAFEETSQSSLEETPEITDALSFEKNIIWYQEVDLLEEATKSQEESSPVDWKEDHSIKADKNMMGYQSTRWRILLADRFTGSKTCRSLNGCS